MNNGNKLKIYFQLQKRVVLAKITVQCLTLCFGLHVQEHNGVSFPNIMVRGKPFTADFVNGVMTERYRKFLKFYAKTAIWKIYVLIQRLSKYINRLQGQKNAKNHETNQHIGKSRGGKTTKIHAVVDGLGNPLHFTLTAGNINDCIEAVNTLSYLPIEGSNVIADKAYGTNQIRDYISSQNASYTIIPKSNTKKPWKYDIFLYKERHLVECFFQKIKSFRRIATRYDKLASSFLAFIYLSAIEIITR